MTRLFNYQQGEVSVRLRLATRLVKLATRIDPKLAVVLNVMVDREGIHTRPAPDLLCSVSEIQVWIRDDWNAAVFDRQLMEDKAEAKGKDPS